MNVSELKAALAGYADDTEVIIDVVPEGTPIRLSNVVEGGESYPNKRPLVWLISEGDWWRD